MVGFLSVVARLPLAGWRLNRAFHEPRPVVMENVLPEPVSSVGRYTGGQHYNADVQAVLNGETPREL